ncbi:23S rRNA (uracil(1939)-C(5))-methyltransferase RlmD [Pseudoteredinibacter isoporae]|uniref:23S rRNA (uracil(1939)-C(5))-methyltransferase RlmD n=1 Tax=Pseudoteredinibacter isoporae TaxID=570281 RepID=UPI00310A2E57
MVRSSHFSRLKTAQALRQQQKGSEGDIQNFDLHIESLNEHGQGCAQGPAKEMLTVPFALPGERCSAKGRLNEPLQLLKLHEVSDQRQQAPCPEYGECGGCQLQHMRYAEQVRFKRERLWQGLSKLINPEPKAKPKSKPKPKLGRKPSQNKANHPAFNSDVRSAEAISILDSSELAYRRRARLGISEQGRLGFRKAASNDTMSIELCPILTPPLQAMMRVLNQALATFPKVDWRSHLGHVELLDVEPAPLALLRVVKTIPQGAFEHLKTVVAEHGWRLAIQSQKDADIEAVLGELDSFYSIGRHTLAFEPGRFIQVNAGLNEAMLKQALQWLQLQSDERVLDLFCGVGNFTLPLAEQAQQVLGIELSEDMVSTAQDNARRLGVDNVEFMAANLDVGDALLSNDERLTESRPDVVLLDPPRAGAGGFIPTLLELSPERILYISCHQGSLLRDLRRLGQASYRLEKLSLMDMFPNTEHVECMALLRKG